jgi:membrane protein implicated in regulation of membrane protease activity
MIEYLSANMWQLWAVLAVLGLILELTSGDFFIICIAIGAACSAIAALFANIYWQLGIFTAMTLFSLFQIRPVLLKYLHRFDPQRTSNADALLGRYGKVTEAIPTQGYGYVAIDGDQWKACTADGSAIAADTRVKVVSRESTIITVVAE